MFILTGKIKKPMATLLIIPKSQSSNSRKSSKKLKKRSRMPRKKKIQNRKSYPLKRRSSQDTKRSKRTRNDLNKIVALSINVYLSFE